MAKVEVYSSFLCGYCARAKSLLESKGVAYDDLDVFTDPGKRQEMIERAGGRTSVPQIFIGGRHIGGCDDLYALERQGALDSLLEQNA
jgi:glutaredoxin 3